MIRAISLFFFAVVFAFISFATRSANDSAASVAAGGIVLKQGSRISIQKERLTISKHKITVEYEFSNDSADDVTTEVAFPIPKFGCEYYCDESVIARFHLWVDGNEAQYERQVRATVKDQDYTAELNKLGIDIASFGHFGRPDARSKDYQVVKLPTTDISKLVQLGLLDEKGFAPKWTVDEMFHWKQIFSAHKLTHIRHEYQPATGYSPMTAGDLAKLANQEDLDANMHEDEVAFLKDVAERSCVEPSLANSIKKMVAEQHKDEKDLNPLDDVEFGMSWADYILTTANSWKGPIRDFTLVVERPDDAMDKTRHYVSFCWDSPVRRLDANHFEAKAINFVPKKELRVAYFDF